MIIHCFIFTMRKYIAYSNIIVSGMKLLESLKKIDKKNIDSDNYICHINSCSINRISN